MAIKDTNYVYAVANIRVKEMGLLTRSDVDAMLAIIPEIVAKLRAMSPLWEKITAGETV